MLTIVVPAQAGTQKGGEGWGETVVPAQAGTQKDGERRGSLTPSPSTGEGWACPEHGRRGEGDSLPEAGR